MSYTTIKMAKKDGDVLDVKEFKNSFGGHAFIWEAIFNKYLKNPSIPYHNWMSDQEKLWAIYEDKKVPDWIRLVHGSTFDNVIVEYEKLSEIAKYYRKFVKEFLEPNTICHLSDWADICDDIFKTETKETCAGICFWGTSVADDPWMVDIEFESEEESWDADETIRPYNLSKDDKHWFLFKDFKQYAT